VASVAAKVKEQRTGFKISRDVYLVLVFMVRGFGKTSTLHTEAGGILEKSVAGPHE
jgi:hypothetical protein